MTQAQAAHRPRLDEIDGLRAVACLMVLAYHTYQFSGISNLGHWIDPLASGVDLFIVLSGFCLFLPVVADPGRFAARRFWKQRARRIVPAYYASIVFVIALPEVLVILWRLSGRVASWQPIPGFVQIITHLVFFQMFSTNTWDGINGSYWSLALEAQFYLAMPLIVLWYRRFGVRGLLIPAALSVMWNVGTQIIFRHGPGFSPLRFVWEANLFGRWLEFVAGAFAAYVVHRTRTGHLRLGYAIRTALSAVGIVIFLIAMYVVKGSAVEAGAFLVLPFGLAVLLIGLSSMPEAKQIVPAQLLRVAPIRLLGLISYSFYLIHQPTEWFLAQFLVANGLSGYTLWAAQLTFGLLIVGSIAWISYILLEKPFIGASRRQSAFSKSRAASETCLSIDVRLSEGQPAAGTWNDAR